MVVWLSAPLVLLGAVVVASALPARHALRVNLLTIMREE
jgi:ABC-type antimicrobial peptide transport system permease subunit